MALADVIVKATRRLANKGRNQYARMRAEAALLSASPQKADGRPRVLFFPSGEAEGASLLRAHNIVDEFRKLGWIAGLVPPVIKLAGRKRIIRHFRPDLLVFQQCRHLLNDGDFSFGVPYVVDTDDADFHLEIPGLAQRLERTVRGARGVITGSRYLRDHHLRRIRMWS